MFEDVKIVQLLDVSSVLGLSDYEFSLYRCVMNILSEIRANETGNQYKRFNHICPKEIDVYHVQSILEFGNIVSYVDENTNTVEIFPYGEPE